MVVEAESSKIGRLILPPALWSVMCAAPRIAITAPVPARAAYLTHAYADVIADPDRLAVLLDPLRAHRGHGVVDGWLALLRGGNHLALAAALIDQHYDPAYAKSRAEHDHDVIGTVQADRLDDSGQDQVAASVAALVNGPQSLGRLRAYGR